MVRNNQISEGDRRIFEAQIRKADGETLWVEVEAHVIKITLQEEGACVRHVLGMVTDISDRKNEEERRQKAVHDMFHDVKTELAIISAIFEETGNQEKEHAKRLFKLLEGGTVETAAAFPAGVIGSTLENLLASAAGEKEEYEDMYPSFAKTAREEGFEDYAEIFEAIAVAEKQHEKRYLALAANIENGIVFKRENPVVWRCRNCGYLHEGNDAPEECPACAHARAHFELLGENY